MRLKNKVALVTGAGSGIGAAIAKGYLAEGARVVFADLNETSARQAALESGFSESLWRVQYVDVSRRESVSACVESVVQAFGSLDILVANAGVVKRQNFFDITGEDYDNIMNINAKGVFFSSQEAARVMSNHGGGSIIHLTSLTAIKAPQRNVVTYGASKGAVLSMTRNMALDLSDHNIRVNAVAPGSIRTNINRDRLAKPEEVKRDSEKSMLGRIGEPEDLVGVAIFLAADESSYMTGQQLVIDGGESAQ